MDKKTFFIAIRASGVDSLTDKVNKVIMENSWYERTIGNMTVDSNGYYAIYITGTVYQLDKK